MKRGAFLLLCLALSSAAFSQVKVSIDYSVQRYIGDVSELDREKYINLHGGSSDSDVNQFYSDYNASGGRGFWGPFSYAKNQTGSVGVYPAPNGGTNTTVRTVTRHVATEHPGAVFEDGLDVDKAADWVVEYYKNFVSNGDVPEFFEPMNEPYVHAGEYGSDQASIRQQMAELFGAIGKAVDSTPELANMKVIGYSSAWPSMELWDFDHWDSRMKLFMDVAGEHMDAFATHLYDGFNVTGQDNYRSGSNSEAILDLIETYSMVKWGVVKPHAITEYGTIVETPIGSDWSTLANGRGNIGQNHIMMGLFDREDRMEISIPFTTDKSTWHINAEHDCQPYGPVLFAPTNLGSCSPAGWEYTPRLLFYKIWKDISGKRVHIKSSNVDIQHQAFVNGNKLYVVVCNIDDNSQTVNLDYLSAMDDVSSVNVKSLKTYQDQEAVYVEEFVTEVPQSVTLLPTEIVAYEYEFSSDITQSNNIRSKNYYSPQYLVNIGGTKTFDIDGVDLGVGQGYATLRLSVGRDINLSKFPIIVRMNGTMVDIPTNWEGYDQAGREDFFGMIPISIPFELLQADNEVSITYGDVGGKISSVILQVELFDEKYFSSIDQNQARNATVEIYPTMLSSGNIKIELENNHPYEHIEILSIDGRKIHSETIGNHQNSLHISTDNIAKGIYLVKLGAKNNQNYNQRIVIN